MKIRGFLLAGCGLLLTIIAIDAGVSFLTQSQALAAPLDLSGVSAIRVGGSASRITVSANAGDRYSASLVGRRDGWGAIWRSGWFSPDSCTPDATMRIESDVLIVDVGRPPRFFDWDWSECTVEFTANVAPEAAVMIDQKATSTALSGDFSEVRIRSDAGDVRFDGHATSLSLSGAALRARLVYQRAMQNETIALAGDMMDAGLRFVQPVPISYLVEATASLVHSALPNTPGAQPAITVRGEMVRVNIE